MGQEFYKWQFDRTKTSIWMYSERGILSYLYHYILVREPKYILDRAENIIGQKLSNYLSFKPHSYTIFTEFELGSKGFGCPDGALLIEGHCRKAFVFIEGKARTFTKEFQYPEEVAEKIKSLDPSSIEFKKVKNRNNYNSSINGQLELRWRFVNCLQEALYGNEFPCVSEQLIKVPKDILRTDRFYWSKSFKPDPKKKGDWRRVNMSRGLQKLYEILKGVDTFLLLAITADKEMPRQKMSELRLFNKDGKPLINKAEKIYWLSLRLVQERFQRV